MNQVIVGDDLHGHPSARAYPSGGEPVAERLVVIGVSAGGLAPLMTLAAALPADFPAAVCIVQHLSPTRPSALPAILARRAALPVQHGVDGQPLHAGHIYICPPDRHMLVAQGRLHLTHGPRQDHWRPSVDALFRSAAHSYGSRAIGVVLSGAMYDGAAGLAAITAHGGTAVVQDPAEAQFSSMPDRALRAVRDARVLPVAEIAPLLGAFAADPDGPARHLWVPALRRKYAGRHRETVRTATGDVAPADRHTFATSRPDLPTCPPCAAG